MPSADFRLKDDVLDPLAPAKVVAVMCYPDDPRGRESLLRRVPRSIIVPREQALRHMPGDQLVGEIRGDFLDHRREGYLAGVLTLTLAQLRALNRRGESPDALALATTLAVELGRQTEFETPGGEKVLPANTRESRIIEAFERYRNVSHLWATLVYGKLKNRPTIQPFSAATLPTFLAYAEEIARLASGLPWQYDEPALNLDADALWKFILPLTVKKTARAQTMDSSIGPTTTPDKTHHRRMPSDRA